MLFARLNRILELDRLRLRGLNGAGDGSSSQEPPRTSSWSQCCSQSRLEKWSVRATTLGPPRSRTDFFNRICE